MSALRWLKDLRFRIAYGLVTRRHPNKVRLGGAWQWTIDPTGLGPDSVVYCAGAGDDISFEKALVERFGCKVVVLDPSPTGKLTMSRPENQTPGLLFEPVGLADEDAEYSFEAPEEREKGSYVPGRARPGADTFPCLSLPTLMRKHGHSRIDLLKMDIEGFEYRVLEQILVQHLPIRQICVEFHHFMLPELSNFDTMKMILRLRGRGYRLIDRVYWDHTFLKS